MAAREKQPSSIFSLPPNSFLFLSLLCISVVLLLFAFSIFQSYPTATSSADFSPPQTLGFRQSEGFNSPCDLSDGDWVYDPRHASGKRYDHTCKEIFKGWNCILNKKANGVEISKWRWKPKQCDLPVFDPVRFLERHRDTSIGFVGDSLNRNMFVSLFCTLKQKSNDIKKWRPAKADRGFTFLQYNLTIAYHRTNLLARYGRWSANPKGGVLESLGYKEGYRVDVDVPDSTWVDAPGFHDIIIFNTGHWWWAPAKFDPVKSPMLFFNDGVPLLPPISPDVGLALVLKRMSSYVENKMRPGGIKIFRTQSPRHFEGGEWNESGSCNRLQPIGIEQVSHSRSTVLLFELGIFFSFGRKKQDNPAFKEATKQNYKRTTGTPPRTSNKRVLILGGGRTILSRAQWNECGDPRCERAFKQSPQRLKFPHFECNKDERVQSRCSSCWSGRKEARRLHALVLAWAY